MTANRIPFTPQELEKRLDELISAGHRNKKLENIYTLDGKDGPVVEDPHLLRLDPKEAKAWQEVMVHARSCPNCRPHKPTMCAVFVSLLEQLSDEAIEFLAGVMDRSSRPGRGQIQRLSDNPDTNEATYG